jgi:RNA polymerase sigma-70 factor (ECF subfamily)
MDQGADDLHHADLAWARALAAGDTAALERYERELVPAIDAQLRRRGHPADAVADVQQTLRARLLVGDGGEPAIARYEGRGPLRAWVLVSALREAVRLRRRAHREPALGDDALAALADRGADGGPAGAGSVDAPGKERYREAFRAAFRAAIAQLSARDRNLLRMHLLDGLTIDQVGAIQGVHRATAARWIERAREAVARAVRRELMRELGVDPFEAEELLGWVQSRIELSLSVLAGDRTAS